MNTKQLRQKILDLAIRGKLVPQDPNDEPASVLLERIKAEKEQLIKEGKIKRGKKSATTSDKPHYPFDLPIGWAWSTLENITEYIQPNKYIVDSTNYSDEYEIPVLTAGKSFILGYTNESNNIFVDLPIIIFDDFTTDSKYVDFPFKVKSSAMKIIKVDSNINIKYVTYFMSITRLIGKTHKRYWISEYSKIPIPIPPINEQNRIVAKIDILLQSISNIELNNLDIYTHLDRIKNSIIDKAISGKLVRQDPADEPAEELLRRINPSAVPADKSHYQHLPQGWCSCRLEDIIDYEQPQRYIVESTEYSDAYSTPVLTAGKSFVIGYTNEVNGIFSKLPVIIFDDFTTDSKYVDFSFKVKSSAMKILHVKNGVNIKYVYYYMSITRLVGKTHKRYWISEYSKLEIPLPPHNEQCRIVEAIENINRRIDDIVEEL